MLDALHCKWYLAIVQCMFMMVIDVHSNLCKLKALP